MIYSFLSKILVSLGLAAWLFGTPVNLAIDNPSTEPIQHLQIVSTIEIELNNNSKQASKPIRQPIKGSCQCPYDRDKAGRTCGRRSAYSRKGGDRPTCYQNE